MDLEINVRFPRIDLGMHTFAGRHISSCCFRVINMLWRCTNEVDGATDLFEARLIVFPTKRVHC